MFIGHFALGFAAKRAAPKASLGLLLAGPQVLDLVWPLFVLAGLERFRIEPGNTAFTPLAFDSYPWSHSLLLSLVWAALFAGLSWIVTRDRATAVVGAALVVSHWLLDAATHRPDMPLVPFGPRVGLGLWNHPLATVVVEVSMFAAGVAIYAAQTRPRDRTGFWSFAALAAFLLAVYGANLAGPPPPNVQAVAWSALLLWLIPVWGVWIDRHRVPREAAASPAVA